MQDDMVPQCGKRMQTRECEERIRQVPVNILGGLKYRPILFDPKVQVTALKPGIGIVSLVRAGAAERVLQYRRTDRRAI